MNVTQNTPTQPRIAVIGAGMSGILAGIKLAEAGYTDFCLFEKAARVGGTWRDNTYPGLTCDVPSQHYCYSFALNPEWSHLFSPGPEIREYFEAVCARYRLAPRIEFERELVAATWRNGEWTLRFADDRTHVCDCVIMATGVLHHPAWPNIPGLDTFAGPCFHTARWNHDLDITDQRVGIIGTGSTAIQILPAIVDKVARVSLFQRTPQWIFPLANPPFSDEDKAAFRAHPEQLGLAYQRWADRIRTTIARAVIGDAEQMAPIVQACEENLAENVSDPALRAALTPDYAVACKRLIMSDLFYPAIQRPNARLVTTGIRGIEPQGVRLEDGSLEELDVLVLATGFDAHRFIRGIDITGDDGRTIDEAWSESLRAHRSITVPGFPNFFMMIGPNSPIGNFSLIMVAEEQIRYILALIDELRQGRCARIAPKVAACDTFNRAVRDAMTDTVWVSGCRSWYLDRHGQPILWPWTLERFLDDMRQPQLDEYERA